MGIGGPDAHNILPDEPDFYLTDQQEIQFGKHKLTALFTPGHTPGATCFFVGTHLFSGDTLFPGGPGHSRTNKDLKQEIGSIVTKLYTLPEETIVWPGHGENTTIGVSKAEYSIFKNKEHDENLHGDVLWLDA